MQLHPAAGDDLEPRLYNFYCAALSTLQRAQVPFLVGGAYALACHTGVVRHTKDFDIFTHLRIVSVSSKSSRLLATELKLQIHAGSLKLTRGKTLLT